MKITNSQFKQLLKEEIKQTLSELGGLAGQLGAVVGRNEPPMEDQADSLIRDKAFAMFRNLGLEEKESEVMKDTIAINDLIELMNRIPKIGTANEEEAV